MIEKAIKKFYEAILDTDRDRALKAVQIAIEGGVMPETVVFNIIMPAVEKIVNELDKGKNINLAQQFITSQIAAEITEKMVPLFNNIIKPVGHVVIGTSQGDFHGLGKRIVMSALKSVMIEVSDLGLNVPPHRFVDEAINNKAQVIAVSSMMAHTARGDNGPSMVRSILKERNLEEKIKIIVGGAPYLYDHNLYKIVKADSWAKNGIEAGKVIIELISKVKNDYRNATLFSRP